MTKEIEAPKQQTMGIVINVIGVWLNQEKPHNAKHIDKDS